MEDTSNDNGTGGSPFQGAEGIALCQPHPKIPSWPRWKVYNTVTSMYLDCWDDGEIARSLSADMKLDLSPSVVAALRGEAAEAGENQSRDIRKKWTYRYKKLTVNNLVKESMFIEGSRNFIEAKRSLAKDVEMLVKTTPPYRLCIAINDAIGRNNIGLDIILQLEAFSLRAAVMDSFVAAFGRARALSSDEAMDAIAKHVSDAFHTECQRNYENTAAVLKRLLCLESHPFEQADVDYFLEYAKLSGEDNNCLMTRLITGADIMVRPKTAIEQVIGGVAHHMSPNELGMVTDSVRSSKVMGRQDLDQIMETVVRQQKNIQTMKQLGWKHKLQETQQSHEHKALEDLRAIVQRHLSLLSVEAFFTKREIAKAERRDITRSDLQVLLDRLNSLVQAEEVKQMAKHMLADRKYDFPIERYLEVRFRLPA